MPIDSKGVWKRNVTWYRNGVGRTDIQWNILHSPNFKIAEYRLPNGEVISISAGDLRRALASAPTRQDGKTVGPYNIDIESRKVFGVPVTFLGDPVSSGDLFDGDYLKKLEKDLADEGVFSSFNIEDARDAIFRAIIQRKGQRVFRNKLIDAYDGVCAITGTNCIEVLEAAHIIPYHGELTNHIQNGILLRADIHTLFDLGLIRIRSDYFVEVSEKLAGTDYWNLNGIKISLPRAAIFYPSVDALEQRNKSKIQE